MAHILLTEPALISVTFIVCFCWLLAVIVICNANTHSLVLTQWLCSISLGTGAIFRLMGLHFGFTTSVYLLICFSYTHKPRMEEISVLHHVSHMSGLGDCVLTCSCRLLIRDAEFFETQS